MAAPRSRRRTDDEGRDYTREREPPVIDPTENVKALSEAANKRQDDLREQLRELIDQHFNLLEKTVDRRFGEIKDQVAFHNAADKDAFDALRREMNQHNTDDTRQHEHILMQSSERMGAMKDLLSASIDGVNRSNAEVKKNVEELRDVVILNQTNSVSSGTYDEFKRGVEAREKVFNEYMLSNQGRGEGIKNFWGQIVAAAVGGAALVTMLQWMGSHLR